AIAWSYGSQRTDFPASLRFRRLLEQKGEFPGRRVGLDLLIPPVVHSDKPKLIEGLRVELLNLRLGLFDHIHVRSTSKNRQWGSGARISRIGPYFTPDPLTTATSEPLGGVASKVPAGHLHAVH